MTTSTTSNAANAADLDLAAALAPNRWARVERVQLIRREIRESLSRHALEILFAHAEQVLEGGLDDDGRAYVTVMLSVDLTCCARVFRERPDAATAERVAELLRDDPWLGRHLRGLAQAALRDRLKRRIAARRVLTDFQVRSRDHHLLVDCDAMLSNEDAAGASR